MNEPEPNDALEALLRQQQQQVADDGFTARVLCNLPPPRNAARLRPLILLAGLAAGLVILLLNLQTVAAVVTGFFEHARSGDLLYLFRAAPVIAAIGSLFWAWTSVGCEEA